MTTKKPDGGPAFPAPGYTNQGMSLRDYFAAKAMQAMVMAEYESYSVDAHGGKWAIDAYAMADDMLAARAAP